MIAPYVEIEKEVRVVLLGDRPPRGLQQAARQQIGDRYPGCAGAELVLLEEGEVRAACVKLAIDAAAAIDIAFASIDLVRADAAWRVLEINSGVMMESAGQAASGAGPGRV